MTHAFDQNQRFDELEFTLQVDEVQITSPASAERAPPGHYMLFIIDDEGVPSKAKIVQLL